MASSLVSASHSDDGKPERTVVFIHIPKAAGCSFTTFLRRHFPRSTVLENAYWEVLRKTPLSRLSQYRLVTGHFGFNVLSHVQNPFVITLLRHPVDRACSVYEYLRASFQRHHEHTFADPDLKEIARQWKVAVAEPFERFFENELPVVRASVFDNPQARQLAQHSPYEMIDLSSQALREIAFARLKTIDVVGCQENFDASLALTCRRLGWSPPYRPTFPRKNSTPKDALVIRHTLSPSLRQKIERRAEVDMELHALAMERLRQDSQNIAPKRSTWMARAVQSWLKNESMNVSTAFHRSRRGDSFQQRAA